MFVVLKKSRLNGDPGAGGALTLHENKIDAVAEAYERASKCEPETYFVGEVEIIGSVLGRDVLQEEKPESDEEVLIARQYPAFQYI